MSKPCRQDLKLAAGTIGSVLVVLRTARLKQFDIQLPTALGEAATSTGRVYYLLYWPEILEA
jgi:hypothetical protein